jgi:hypothetical protein
MSSRPRRRRPTPRRGRLGGKLRDKRKAELCANLDTRVES